MAYGQHKDLINEFDLIVLAPQMASMFKELEEDVKITKQKLFLLVERSMWL